MTASQYIQSSEPEKSVSEIKILAQDPNVIGADGNPLMATVAVPTDRLADGPHGHRFRVIDYDASSANFVKPSRIEFPDPRFHGWGFVDPLADATLTEADLLGDEPGRSIRCQNVYAVAARTLALFESALGRRLPWGFGTHELYLVPHAFAEANAYYSREDHALFFGYVDAVTERIYTCLSHDIVAHETAHAVLDGLRPGFMQPGLPDQRGFHEGFADIVSLLSVFSVQQVVEQLLGEEDRNHPGQIPVTRVSSDALSVNPLFKLATQLGDFLSDERGNGLRRSVGISPNQDWRRDRQYAAPHRRGEILVAAVVRTLLAMWVDRLVPLTKGDFVDRERAAEEGAKSARHMLRMAIRAIDYTPPIEFEFEDFIAAILRSDREVAPMDDHGYRQKLADNFAAFDIVPNRDRTIDLGERRPVYAGVNFDALKSGRDEMFRFIWANADYLGVAADFYLNVDDVQPSIRFGPDGLIVNEIVASYRQSFSTTAGELRDLSRNESGNWQLALPRPLNPDTQVSINGGGTLVFDQFGMLKYHSVKPLFDWDRQRRRLDHLYAAGEHDRAGRYGFSSGDPEGQAFAGLHVPKNRAGEDW